MDSIRFIYQNKPSETRETRFETTDTTSQKTARENLDTLKVHIDSLDYPEWNIQFLPSSTQESLTFVVSAEDLYNTLTQENKDTKLIPFDLFTHIYEQYLQRIETQTLNPNSDIQMVTPTKTGFSIFRINCIHQTIDIQHRSIKLHNE